MRQRTNYRQAAGIALACRDDGKLGGIVVTGHYGDRIFFSRIKYPVTELPNAVSLNLPADGQVEGDRGALVVRTERC